MLKKVRSVDDYISYIRNFIGFSLQEVVDELVWELARPAVESKPASVLGRFIYRTFREVGPLLYSPKILSKGDAIVYINVREGKITLKDADVSETIELYDALEKPIYLIGRVLELFNFIEYSEQYTGAEAQDYSQEDSDIEEDKSIGFNV